MNPAARDSLSLTGDELALLDELLETARAKLLIEIRHTDHRVFRDELRHRLAILEGLIDRLQHKS